MISSQTKLFRVSIVTEGPTAKYKALRILKIVGGQNLRNIFVRSKMIHIEPRKLVGKKLSNVETFGKNIVLVFDCYAIRIHLMLYGSIHVYDINENLKKPERQVRLLLVFNDKKVVVYNAPVVELDTASKILRKLRKSLGEDPLREDWNPSRAVRLILKRRERKIGDVLLDQRVIAGIGNIIRNEILFRARIHPERVVKDLDINEVRRIVEVAEKFMKEFFERRTKGLRIKPILMVYGKSKKPCPICGRPIKFYRQRPNNRRTYVCENCQK